MNTDTYQSISGPGEGIYRDKGSKFIGLAFPLSSEKEVKEIIDTLRKEHPGAVHFCYSYRIGPEGEIYRANDDGEPAGSAGKPIYNQLLSAHLSDILLVVVRYFGGTKLGVSGLITAYKEAAKEALKTVSIVEKTISTAVTLGFPFHLQGEAEKLIKEFRAVLVEKSFAQACRFTIKVPKSKMAGFLDKISVIREMVIERVEKDN